MVARRPKPSTRVARGSQANAPKSAPEILSYAPPAPARLPIGGTTAGSSGGTGSAPHVTAAFELLMLAFLTLVVGRCSLDMAPWGSALLASRLEHPD
jgi:hypothetical protein